MAATKLGEEVQLERDVQNAAILQEQKIGSADDLKERADTALSRYHELGDLSRPQSNV